ncbi:2-methylthioadenine synthetase [Candidatus Scalindua japonica]|uniref:Threonylcarbamoyladenosine tRNA methylthiotransferase MtaB n=1 Tax=Candidatus Scalindua japonica TaxID=1284222 RepID=A0A286TZ21_9BACT|nr:tRNA (N(6)-L-threonylcarbamoyladenosine(37)-C(2))-methylthiotransferase MtaB [Candidatus Scalindua japonica]GAX61061.1 2-methylthioadenine synthetase [Candidatus Scalindua japonica]
MKTCSFITLGCKVNQYETQALREAIISSGYEEASLNTPVDLCVINTCTVTSTSDDKSRQQIRKVIRNNPDATVIVTGCYAESDAEAIKKIDGVGYVFEKGRESKIIDFVKNGSISNSDSGTVPSKIRDSKTKKLRRNLSAFNLKVSKFDGHTRAFLKIEDGCDIFCSYCIIPYVRGKVISKKIDDILFEAEQLVRNGYKEIVLTGIHLGAYGKETGYQRNITDVLEQLQSLQGLKRIRISSIEVNEVTDGLIELIAASNKVCPHFHLPLQSGDDYILKRMNRKYNTAQFIKTLEKIREKIKLPSISTDVLVGFPGEERKHFENTLGLCEKAGFSRTHIFPYSPRKDTPAAKMPDHCRPSDIKTRKKELESLTAGTSLSYKYSFTGKNISILVENTRDKKTGKLCGYSDRYIKVLFDGSDNLINEIVDIQVEKVLPQYVMGTYRK